MGRLAFNIALLFLITAIIGIGLLMFGLRINHQLAPRAYGKDLAQFENVPPHVRQWFKSVKSKMGVPCCDIADGHRTDFDIKGEHYWVPIDGNWMQVPPEAVVHNSGNPTGDAVVWYTKFPQSGVHIRCFVPGGGV